MIHRTTLQNKQKQSCIRVSLQLYFEMSSNTNLQINTLLDSQTLLCICRTNYGGLLCGQWDVFNSWHCICNKNKSKESLNKEKNGNFEMTKIQPIFLIILHSPFYPGNRLISWFSIYRIENKAEKYNYEKLSETKQMHWNHCNLDWEGRIQDR